jgi:hypothetical protein
MHFNTKYIFQGDSEDEIVRKTNYNFGQIISFACGVDGHFGPKGSTGQIGPSGKKGAAGISGPRGSLWFRQNLQPDSNLVNTGDLWIDTSTLYGAVNSLSATGAWNPTGYSVLFSPYFETYDGVLGPGRFFDKYAIGLSNSGKLIESETSLVFSDKDVSLLDSNPNRSKLVISTLDQSSKPILSFIKSNRVVSGGPSFYWTSPGSYSLTFKTDSDLSINSLFSANLFALGPTGSPSLLASPSLSFSGNSMSFSQLSSTGGIYFSGTGDFSLYSNTTVGSGSNFVVNSNLISISSSYFSLSASSAESSWVDISSTGGTPGVGSYIMNISKTPTTSLPSSTVTSGTYPTVLIDASKNNYALNVSQKFTGGATAYTIFSSSPRKYEVYSNAEIVNKPFVSQTKFGAINPSATGGTGGPYFYHVKKVSRVYQITPTTYSNYTDYYTRVISGANIYTFAFDISSPAIWINNDVIVVSQRIIQGVIANPYIKIPGPEIFTYPGFDANKTYRIIFDANTNGAQQSQYASGKISGLLWQADKLYRLGFPRAKNIILTVPVFYVDITYVDIPGLSQGKRILYKLSSGSAGFAILGNQLFVE